MTDSEPREDRRQQPKPPKSQFLSAKTAAKKLGIYLPAAPAEFQESQHSRDELAALQADPPAWLQSLRVDGPHPRDEVSRRLGVTNSSLARSGVSDAMTTDEIKALLADPPQWLIDERRRTNP
ncbi:DUF5997 family protein [Salinibacterium sp. ZJ77]|uniref:DUF5997 family protein n=1 Tax=Salinibacterium sp. ZJ77 TaxID=2708337 RepID=UPI001FBBF675|nr:DUF5997 family protein [Salinibacterium sp. ZJ77]